MRISNEIHESHPWRIREIAPEFTLEDVWELPAHGDADDFPELLRVMASLDPASADSRATQVLWKLRDLLGKWFGLGRTAPPGEGGSEPEAGLPIPGSDDISLMDRMPENLRDTVPDGLDTGGLFDPLFLTGDEYAAELSNKTVHGVIHLTWIDRGDDDFQGRLAVYVKPRGRLGQGYMALISPFRHWIVYPAFMRQIERAWDRRDRRPPAA